MCATSASCWSACKIFARRSSLIHPIWILSLRRRWRFAAEAILGAMALRWGVCFALADLPDGGPHWLTRPPSPLNLLSQVALPATKRRGAGQFAYRHNTMLVYHKEIFRTRAARLHIASGSANALARR